LVDELVNTTTKRFGGRVSFLIATARAGLRYRNQRVRIVFDDDTESAVDVTINTVAVANGRYFGGGMFIAPEAELDDGKFDVVMLGDFNLKDMVMTSRRLYAGTHLSMDKVSVRHATKVYAESLDGSDVRIDLDGETPGVLPATFSLMPRAIRVVVP